MNEFECSDDVKIKLKNKMLFNQKHVAILCGISGILNLITCICVAVVWIYWSSTLNTCNETHCECILFGQVRGSSFVGGQPFWCKSITYFTVFISLVSFVVAGYFLMKVRNWPKSISTRNNQEGISHIRRGTNFSLFFKLFAGLVVLLLFIQASALMEGYTQTCKEYKGLVTKYLKANGDLSDLINERMSCSTMYDFLDYLHPDSIVRSPYLPQYYYHRTSRINTGSILLVSVIFSWLNVLIWSIITVFVGFCK